MKHIHLSLSDEEKKANDEVRSEFGRSTREILVHGGQYLKELRESLLVMFKISKSIEGYLVLTSYEESSGKVNYRPRSIGVLTPRLHEETNRKVIPVKIIGMKLKSKSSVTFKYKIMVENKLETYEANFNKMYIGKVLYWVFQKVSDDENKI